MAVSEDHTTCWVHIDRTVTTKQVRVLLTAARTSGGKNECKVHLTGTYIHAHTYIHACIHTCIHKHTCIHIQWCACTHILEQEYWMGTEIGILGGHSFRSTVTAGDGSNHKGGKWEQVIWICREKGKGSRGRSRWDAMKEDQSRTVRN